MCDHRCSECRKCDEPEKCACGLNTGSLGVADCGHLICDDCMILCELCGEATFCPACVQRDSENNKCCEECVQ